MNHSCFVTVIPWCLLIYHRTCTCTCITALLSCTYVYHCHGYPPYVAPRAQRVIINLTFSHLRTLEELSLSGTLYSQVISTPYIMPGLCPVGDWNVCVISGSLHFWTVTQLDVLPQCDFKAEYAFQRKLKKYHGVYQVGVVLKEKIPWVYKGWVWCWMCEWRNTGFIRWVVFMKGCG